MKRGPLPSFARIVAILCLSIHAGIAYAADSARYYEDALARYERKDIPGAIIQLKNALQEDPRNLSANILLGKAYLHSLRPDAAMESFNKALSYGADKSEVTVPMAQALLDQGKANEVVSRFPPESVTGARVPELLLVRGLAQRRIGDTTGAVASLERAIALSPRSSAPQLALAELRMQQGRRQDAVKLIDGVIAANAADARAWLMRGTILSSVGDVNGALAAYEKSLAADPTFADARVAHATLLLNMDRVDAAEVDIEYFRRNNPTEIRAKYLRAVVAGKKKDGEAARLALTEVSQAIDPLPVDALKSRAPDLLLLGALAYHGLGSMEKARVYLEHFVAVQPNHLGARRLLGSILVTQRDFVGATKMLEPVLQALPNDAQTLAMLANAYMARGRAEIAGQYLQKALAAGASAPQVHATLGFSLLQQGQQELGLQHLQTAFAKDPMGSGTGLPLAVAYMRQGQPKRAVEVAQAMLKAAPGDPIVLNLMGVAKMAAGDNAGAKTAFQEAIRGASAFSAPQLNLAKLEANDGNVKAARERLQAMLKANPRDTQATVELANLEERDGRRAEAIRLLERARSVDGRNVPVAMLLAEIYMRGNEASNALQVARSVEAYASSNLELQQVITHAMIATNDVAGARANLQRMARIASTDPGALLRVAQLQLQADDAVAASDTVAKALGLAPNLLAARALQVEVDLRRGQYDLAAGRAAALTRSQPDEAIGYRLAGDVALARGKYADAVADYRAALAKQSTVDHAIRVFRALAASGNPGTATAFLEGWAKDKPADPAVRRALAEGALRAGNLPVARQRYEQILKDGGEDGNVLNNLANVLARQNDPGALEVARRAYKVMPEDAGVLDTLGWLLVQGGSLDAGLKHLREARVRAPGNPEIRYHLAAVLAQTGRKAEAREELDAVLAEHPVFEESESARRLLRSLSES